jgi:hypothetical protein
MTVGEKRVATSRWVRAATVAALLLAAAGVVVAAAYWAFLRPAPSDADLIARFRGHRSEFQTLALAAWSDPDSAGSPTRSRFSALLRSAGVSGIRRSGDGAVWLEAMSNYDLRKGFVFSMGPMAPEHASLDSLESPIGNGYLRAAYRPIAPHWYLFIEARE